MLLILSFIIDAVLLGGLLLIVAKVDTTRDFIRPLAIIIYSAIPSIMIKFFLSGVLGALLSLIAYLLVFYYSLSWFFDIEPKKKKIIFGTFIAVRILWAYLSFLLQ